MQSSSWKKCSSCKKDIGFGVSYYICSVSTCQSKATQYAFCSIPCWDAHLPVERHRSGSAGAIERRAPASAGADAPKRVVVARSASPSEPSESDVLVVVTKVRKYIFDRSGMNTSGSVYAVLTEKIKMLCEGAMEKARQEGRKTVMDRDF